MFSTKLFSNTNWTLILMISAIVLFSIFHAAYATDVMPWDKGIGTLLKSIKGPVATGICIAGIVGVGGGLAFGGELSQFMKTAIILVAVVCLIIGASSFLTSMGGEESSGAAVPGFVDMATAVINK